MHKMMRFGVLVQGGGGRCEGALSETQDVVRLRQIGSQLGRQVEVTTVMTAETTLQPLLPARRVGMAVGGHLATPHTLYSHQHQTPGQQSTNRISLAPWCPPRLPYNRLAPVLTEPNLQLSTSYGLASGARRETLFARRLARPHAFLTLHARRLARPRFSLTVFAWRLARPRAPLDRACDVSSAPRCLSDRVRDAFGAPTRLSSRPDNISVPPKPPSDHADEAIAVPPPHHRCPS